jgi:hypothetical protein
MDIIFPKTPNPAGMTAIQSMITFGLLSIIISPLKYPAIDMMEEVKYRSNGSDYSS